MIRLILLLSLLTAFPPLATDMYLPALPTLAKIWNQPVYLINLTLVIFFAVYCIFILIYGPLSDKYGRKPPLLSGIAVYIISCFLCAASFNVYMLIFSRILQAAGAASAATIALAIAKDRFPPNKRERVLSYIAVIIALAPMLAPMIGSLVLIFFNWRWIFIIQAVFGIISFIFVFLMKESNLNKKDVSAKELTKGFGKVLKNKNFTFLIVCFSMLCLPIFAFIAASSFIYINVFKISETMFSVFFGINAVAVMAGSMTCARFGYKIGTSRLINIGILGGVSGGILMLLKVFEGPFQFTVPMAVISYTFGLSRPPSNNLILEQVTEDTGTASSLMIFSYFILGAVSMAVVSFGWPDKIIYIGSLASLCGLISFILWCFIKPYIVFDLKK
ncbi:MAG: multidrug effflux MFS transporter [Desulfobacteraceae bacterium]|jgi:DHA1 family bicyclomycin/chloramphenicol resistance-like MFS transporter